jgi:hypothetical protein
LIEVYVFEVYVFEVHVSSATLTQSGIGRACSRMSAVANLTTVDTRIRSYNTSMPIGVPPAAGLSPSAHLQVGPFFEINKNAESTLPVTNV